MWSKLGSYRYAGHRYSSVAIGYAVYARANNYTLLTEHNQLEGTIDALINSSTTLIRKSVERDGNVKKVPCNAKYLSFFKIRPAQVPEHVLTMSRQFDYMELEVESRRRTGQL